MLRGKTCTHTHRFKSLALRMPSDVASLLSLWLLSSSFQFFFFLAQTPPLRPCRWAVYLSPPSPVSDLLFMSLHLSLFPALWSRVWVLLGERCATQMMSHPVTLSSPPLLSSPFLTLQPSRLSHRTEHFSPYKTNSDLSHVPQDGTRGHTTAVISSSRRPLRLTETSNRHFRKSSRHHINRRTLLQTCRCLVVCRYRHFLIFFFCSNTLFFLPSSSSVHTRGIQMLLFSESCDGIWHAHNISKALADSSHGLLCMFSDLCFICFFATVTVEPGLCWKWQIISCFAWAKLSLRGAENVSIS